MKILILFVALSASVVSLGQVTSEKYVIDRKETVVEWKSGMAAYKDDQVGYVYVSKGELTIEKGKLAAGVIEIDMNTIEHADKKNQNTPIKHIKSDDLLDVEKFPTSKFVITKVVAAGTERIQVVGNLTLKDVTKPITFPAKIKIEGGVITATGKVTIDRTEWGIRYKSGKFYDNLADGAILDEIELDMKVVARKK